MGAERRASAHLLQSLRLHHPQLTACNPSAHQRRQELRHLPQRVPSPLTPTRTSRRVRERTAAESPTCVPLFFFPTHPPCLCGGVSGLRSGADVISGARAAAAQHKQLEGPVDRGRHRQQAAAAHAHQRRQRPRARPQQLQQRRRRRQLQQPPAASPLAARGGSQCEPTDRGRLGPRSAGGCRRFDLQQPTLGRSAKGAHSPK